MGDSDDDEYGRRRARDKFRRERNDNYQDRPSGNRSREDWQDNRESGGSWNANRDRMQGGGRRDNYNRESYGQRQGRDRYSPGDRSELSPPMKRPRGSGSGRDWEDRSGGNSGYQNYNNNNMDNFGHNNWNNSMDNNSGGQMGGHGRGNDQHNRDNENGLTQPAMMSFKQYLATLDDSIDDQEAVKKYSEYKMEFKKKQIIDFFNAHKNEEWFRSKYFPEEIGKRKSEQAASLQRRLDVFLDLLQSGWIDSVTIDVEKANQIIRLLDAVVIKLEGGNDFDLKSLDENFEEEKPKDSGLSDLSLFAVEVEKPKKEVVKGDIRSENGEDTMDSESGMDRKVDDNGNANNEDQKENEEKDVSSGDKAITLDDDDSKHQEMEEGEEASRDASNNENIDKDKESEEPEIKKVDEEVKDDEVKFEKEQGEEDKKEEAIDKPRALHKTVSIFLRNLAPSITKEEVEALCNQYKGLLRIAIADPQPERRFFRRAWATYERHVNIREICWALNAVKLRDCELGAIVNRDLTRRIRSVNGIASHMNVIRADIRHAAKIVYNLDQQKKLWIDESVDKDLSVNDDKKPLFGFASKNPLLKNITDYLIEEASAEEEELLGLAGEDGALNEDGETGIALERDESVVKVLDRLLLYLRIVHSLDYYNHSEYPNEDEMPNRIGIMHARGMLSSSSVFKKQDIDDYIKSFEPKILPFLQPAVIVTEDEAHKLGWKDPEDEVETFIKANTQELAKDKWLCPLSGKKFKGPDFVKKHILSKHLDKIEEAKKNAEYLNNYIYDSKRPQLPEHPSNRPASSSNAPNRGDQASHSSGMAGNVPPYMHHGGPGGHYPPPPWGYGPRGPPMGGFGPMMAYGPMTRYPPPPPHEYGRGPAAHKPRFTRKRINYRDLDAPEDQDL